MLKKVIQKIIKNKKGAVLIEFALISPILVALVLGIIEFGWIYNGYITLNGAAREGARVASIYKVFPGDEFYDGYIEAEVEKHVTNTLENVSTNIEYPVLQSGGGQNVKKGVRVTVNGTITPLIGLYVSADSVVFTAEATMGVQ